MKRWVVLDFETASSVDLKEAGAWRYAEHPDTEIICACYSIMGEEPQCWTPEFKVYGQKDDLNWLVSDPDVVFIAHGAGFEKAIWRHIMVPDFGFPNIPNERWHDIMAVCAHKALPLALEIVLQVLGIEQQKDMEGRKITLGMSRLGKDGTYDRSQDKRTRVLQYCQQDVVSEVALHRYLGWLPAGERTIWLLNQKQNEYGVRLDLEFVRAAQRIVDEVSTPLLNEFANLTGLRPGQGKKFLAWLSDHELQLPNLTKETIAELIGTDEGDEDDSEGSAILDLPADVFRALRIRQLVNSTSVKKLKRMEACVSADGRARGLSQYHGTAPGRASGRLLQPYNFPRGTLQIDVGGGKTKAPKPQQVVDAIMTGDYEYVEQTIGSAMETVVSSLRHALVPGSGRVFLSGDYAGIQARVVLALAGQFDKCAIFSDDLLGRKGEDIYLDMANQIYRRVCTKDDMKERQTGKNSVLGLGFEMAWQKFKLKYGKGHTDEFCQEIVRVYRKEWAPKVPYVWYGLGDAAIACVHTRRPHTAYGVEYRIEGDALSCRLPSGRKIWYQHPKPTKDEAPWLKPGETKPGFSYHTMQTGHWQEKHAFGGLLTENVVMGIEVDIQRRAQLLCEKAGMPVVLEVYDEIVVEVEESKADEKAFRQILLDVEPWVKALRVPIAVDIWQGDRYKK